MIMTGRITEVSSASTLRVLNRTLRVTIASVLEILAGGLVGAVGPARAVGEAVTSGTGGHLIVRLRGGRGVTGQREEHVVQGRAADRECAYGRAVGVEVVEQSAHASGAAVGGGAASRPSSATVRDERGTPPGRTRHHTKALTPVIARPTMRVFIS
jgi:hypothetical protein